MSKPIEIDLSQPGGKDAWTRATGGMVKAGAVKQAVPIQTYHATLPYPPTANHLHAVYRGRKILSRKGREYYADVEAFIPTGGPFTGKLAVTINAWMPDKRRRDLSNVLKALEDAMTYAGFWEDDSQICDLRITRAGVEKPGRVEVYIQEYKP